MRRRWIYLAVVLAVALAVAAYEARGADPAAQTLGEPPRQAAESVVDPAADASETQPGTDAASDACSRCDARQKDKARLREALAAQRAAAAEGD